MRTTAGRRAHSEMASVSSLSTNCVRASVRFFTDKMLRLSLPSSSWTSEATLAQSEVGGPRAEPAAASLEAAAMLPIGWVHITACGGVWYVWLTKRGGLPASEPVQDAQWVGHLRDKLLPKSCRTE